MANAKQRIWEGHVHLKIMLDLPWATNRCLIEPLTDTQHLSKVLVKRYLSFIDSIEKSEKMSLKQLLRLSRRDVRTVTGHNLISIMLLAGNTRIDDLDLNTKIDHHRLNQKKWWNKLELSWAKLSPNWDWTVIKIYYIVLVNKIKWIKWQSLVDFTIVKHGQMKSGILLISRIVQNSQI